MEEDIKDIQEILTVLDNTTKEQLDEAIRNVDKEWSEMELNEDIKVLEEMLDIDKHLGKFLSDNRRQAIENLINRNKELESELQHRNDQLFLGDTQLEKYIDRNYIPKSIIKARIEKLKVLAEKADDETLNACELDIRKNQIYLLQSLLQEGDDK